MTTDIHKMIEEAISEGFADEEISDMINAIQDENIKRMERRAQTLAAFAGKPMALLDGEVVWYLGTGKTGDHIYAAMTHDGAMREVILPSSSPKPKRL